MLGLKSNHVSKGASDRSSLSFWGGKTDYQAENDTAVFGMVVYVELKLQVEVILYFI